MTLSQLTVARAHWMLGALFLAIILEDYVPLLGSDGRRVGSRSAVVPSLLILSAVGVWATTVFADFVDDMLVHTLWGDILFAAGALEFARRRGVYERPWLEAVFPVALVSCGVLFIVHEIIHSSGPGDRWHVVMGTLLILAGSLELVRVRRRRAPLIPLAVLPLTGFALALIAIPVSAAS